MLSMVNGMATVKLTITRDEHQFDDLQQLVAAGQAASVSGFVRKAVETALHDAAGWKQILDDALEASGGPLTDAERRWADRILGHGSSRTKTRSRK